MVKEVELEHKNGNIRSFIHSFILIKYYKQN